MAWGSPVRLPRRETNLRRKAEGPSPRLRAALGAGLLRGHRAGAVPASASSALERPTGAQAGRRSAPWRRPTRESQLEDSPPRLPCGWSCRDRAATAQQGAFPSRRGPKAALPIPTPRIRAVFATISRIGYAAPAASAPRAGDPASRAGRERAPRRRLRFPRRARPGDTPTEPEPRHRPAASSGADACPTRQNAAKTAPSLASALCACARRLACGRQPENRSARRFSATRALRRRGSPTTHPGGGSAPAALPDGGTNPHPQELAKPLDCFRPNPSRAGADAPEVKARWCDLRR